MFLPQKGERVELPFSNHCKKNAVLMSMSNLKQFRKNKNDSFVNKRLKTIPNLNPSAYYVIHTNAINYLTPYFIYT